LGARDEAGAPPSSLLWRVNRLRAMAIPEVVWRLGLSARDGFEQFKSSVGAIRDVPVPTGRAGKPWMARLPKCFDPEPYVQAGNRILSGQFDIFALRSTPLGFPPKWNRDPKTGTRAPMSFGRSLDYRVEKRVGDIKYLWELNRHLEVFTLSQAFHLTGEARFALGVRDLLDSWFQQCPYPWGPNWITPLEHAVRLVNWSYSWHLLGGEDSLLFADQRGRRFRHDWLSGVYRHLYFLRGNLSRYSSANNHLLGEFMGLFIGTTTWPLWPECPDWNALARNGLEKEVLRQNGADGVNREQAVWYEHEAADMLLHSGLTGRANGTTFSEAYWKRLESMLEHLASIMDVKGHVPMFGDSDDAVVVRFSHEPDFNPYRSLLATGAALLDRGDFKLKATRFDEKSRWLLGDEAAVLYEELPVGFAPLPVRRAFPDGGYWVLGDKFETGEEIRLVADAGPLGYLSIAAHGHADALSFTLSVRGKEILIDPGTYAYHTERKWRNYFRGTAAHNTIRVDRQDQSVSGGSFLWLNHARAKCHRFESSVDRDVWEASHDGYLRLRDPVRHRRKIILDKRSGTIVVTDLLQGDGRHRAEQFWHFAEGCVVSRNTGKGIMVRHGDVTILLVPPEPFRTRLARGDETSPAGWVSRRFDEKIPTWTLICEGTMEGGTPQHTVILHRIPGS
jgi:hypothetical protein